MIEQVYKNKIILITGAASGIGQAQMHTYLDLGATVIALDKQPITDVHAQLTAFQIDLANQADVSAWLQANAETIAHVDVFLSTAGILDAFVPALETDLARIQQVMNTNVYAGVQLTLALLPGMVERQAGKIVYMASIAGQIAGGGGAAYTMSKHALIGWMKQLALDYSEQGININAIAPGAIETPMNAADFAGDGKMAQWVAQETPMKRWANPQEVADLTLYLTSPQASYVQGQVFTIDGGWTIK